MIWALERKTLTAYLRHRARLEMAPDINVLFDLMSESEKPPAPKLYSLRDGEAHINIQGILSRKRSFWAMLFGSAPSLTYDEIAIAVGQADTDPAVKAIVLDINTPGGGLDGVDVAAQAVKAAAKPTEARVDNLAASAGYWIASQADTIVATSPAASFGSIGLIAEFMDDTRAWKEIGVDIVLIASTDAPDKKAAAQPTTEAGQAVWQKELDDLHVVFAGRVAEGRGVSIKTVNSDFGRGGVLVAEDARAAGMIDRVIGAAEPIDTEPEIEIEPEEIEAGVAGKKSAARAAQEEVQVMNLDQLKTEHPDVYRAAVAVGDAEGVNKERARVNKLREWAESDPVCEDIVAKAIVSGETAENVLPQLMAAIKKGAGGQGKAAENPPAVGTDTAATGSGEGEDMDAQIKAVLAKIPKA